MVQELKDMHTKAGETLPLWQEFTGLSDRCSLHLQRLWCQWDEVSRSSPQQDTQAMLHSVEVSSGFKYAVCIYILDIEIEEHLVFQTSLLMHTHLYVCGVFRSIR